MAEAQRTGWRNWSREQRCTPREIVRPRTREGLIDAVGRARAAGRQVKVAGSGHSFTPAALTDGTMLRIESLDRLLDADRATGLVKVEAGIVLGELNRKLDRLGLAFESLGDIDHQTLAGSISTGTHGTGIRFQNLSAQLEEIELVLADGSLLTLDGRDDPGAFRAARIGLGALGAIYSVTLRTVPAFRIDRTDRARPLEEALDGLDELVESFDHFELYVFPHTETALCRESVRTDEPALPPHRLAAYAQEVVVQNWVAGAFAAIARRAPAAIPALARVAAKGAGTGRRRDASHRVYPSERRIPFTEMEYAVPRERAQEAVARVLAIASRPELAVAFPIEVRFVAADDALLSPAHERESCYVAVHQHPASDWRTYFAAVEALMAELGGRPHWGKRHTLAAPRLRELYPRFGDFLAVRDRLDPEGAFANVYTDRVLGPAGEQG